MTVANTNKLVNLFTDDGKAYVDELPEDGTIKVIITSKNVYLDEMRNSLDEMLPAHLSYYLRRIINIDDNDDDEDEGMPDGIIDVTDESTAGDYGSAFLMRLEFPIYENLPYGKAPDAPKYDGSVKVSVPYMQNGELKYNGEKRYNGLNNNAKRVGYPVKWWFAPTGNSTFNKAFKHDGAILYNGLQPLTVEYDDRIDELSVVKIQNTFEEKIIEKPLFDGSNKYDGDIVATSRELPADNNGIIEISRHRRYNGRFQFNGGDINRFNGSIKAEGKFTFEGNGIKAQSETLIDKLDGKLTVLSPDKEKPLTDYSPDYFDYVPKTVEKQITRISNPDLHDTVKQVADVTNAIRISKVIRYDGIKLYDGGDMNYFNGAIKADGKFTFESEGNQAKFEIIAIDKDGNFSVKHTEKNNPLPYIEEFDFVNTAQGKSHFTAQLAPVDYINPRDCDGKFILRRRSRYNGFLLYGGYFEYPADASKRFDGNLNYDNVYITKSDGKSRFNGENRYGGRKNSNFIEYTGDIEGNPIFVDTSNLKKLPIATRTRLGLVIIGENLNVTEEGKISMPDKFKSTVLNEIQSGELKRIYQSRRNINGTY